MNSRSILGTHHIFFAPRLEVVGCQDKPNRFSPDLWRDTRFNHTLGDQTNRPTRASFGRWAADQRDDRSLLRTVELPLWNASRIVGECCR
jgi:hypothetical protein